MKSLLLLALLSFAPLVSAELTPEEFAKQEEPYLIKAAELYPDSTRADSRLAARAREIYTAWQAAKDSRANDASGSLLCYVEAAKQLGIQPLVKVTEYAIGEAKFAVACFEKSHPQPTPADNAILQRLIGKVTTLEARFQNQQAAEDQARAAAIIAEKEAEYAAIRAQTQRQQLANMIAERDHARQAAAAINETNRIIAERQAEAEYQARLTAFQQYNQSLAQERAQAAAYAAASAEEAAYRRSQEFSTPPSPAPVLPGGDLLNTVDYHFSPGGAWLHGSDGNTFHVTHPAPGVTRFTP